MCIIAPQLPDGISLQMLDLFFSNSHREKYILLSCSESCLCLTFADLFHAVSAREPLAGPWSVITPQTILHFSLSKLSHASGISHPLLAQLGLSHTKKGKKNRRKSGVTEVCLSLGDPTINVWEKRTP